MTSWRIEIPYRDRGESLVVTAGHARVLGQDEARVTRQLVLSAFTDGLATTAGGLIDHLDGLDPHQRRAMLDRAREAVGLPSTRSVELADPPMRIGDFDRRPVRWEHREGGPLVEVFESDAVTRELDERRLRVEAQARDAERAVDVELARQRAQGLAEQLARELPEHMRPLS